MEKKHYDVVAAVVKKDNKYLCMQRCRSRYEYTSEKWEFPGGKIEYGENGYEALIREIKEEMDWDVFVGSKIATIIHEYPDFIISLTAYKCLGSDYEFKLLDHLDFKWLAKEDMYGLNWTEADRKLLELLE
jgi:8-oxo-dGTP diphosphatase